jgi:hypothetical protein
VACTQGLEAYFGGFKEVVPKDNADSKSYSSSHVLELQGFFIARVTGSHRFELWSGTYSWSSILYTPKTTFELDGASEGPHQRTWQYTTRLAKDFGYSMSLVTNDNYYYVKISIDVEFSGRSKAELDGDLIARCWQGGCRDLLLSRSPYSYQPSPSMSPSPTRSKSPSPTENMSPSPSMTPEATES